MTRLFLTSMTTMILSFFLLLSSVRGFVENVVVVPNRHGLVATRPTTQSLGLLCGNRNTKARGVVVPTLVLGATRQEDNDNDDSSEGFLTNTPATPLDRPLLAAVDAVALMGFAVVGKASHSTTDGSLDVLAVLFTSLPFLLAWFATSPLTGVYQPTTPQTADSSNLAVTTVRQVAPGWAVAIPLGCVLRGLVKGYVPPTSFVIVTMIATLIILTLARLAFAIVEDFFVELVN